MKKALILGGAALLTAFVLACGGGTGSGDSGDDGTAPKHHAPRPKASPADIRPFSTVNPAPSMGIGSQPAQGKK